MRCDVRYFGSKIRRVDLGIRDVFCGRILIGFLTNCIRLVQDEVYSRGLLKAAKAFGFSKRPENSVRSSVGANLLYVLDTFCRIIYRYEE